MTEYPGFGVVLQRLLKHRGLEVGELAAAAGIAESGLQAVVNGAAPDLLHALAPALGYQVPDLFVLADVPLPEELTPLDPGAGMTVGSLINLVDCLPPHQRREISELVAGLPQEPRPDFEGPVPGIYSPAEGGFGAVLVTMLCHNRNLRNGVAYTMAVLSRGRMYLSRPTYPAIATRHSPLLDDPELIASVALVLDIPVGDLCAMTGVPLPEKPLNRPRRTPELIGLLWNCRRLTLAQAKQVYAAAEAMVVPIPEGAPEREWTRIYHAGDGVWWGVPYVREE